MFMCSTGAGGMSYEPGVYVLPPGITQDNMIGRARGDRDRRAEDWGDRMTPGDCQSLQKKQLLPVARFSELDRRRGFVRPEYPTQVIVSYFEAGKICDYIAKKWGGGALLGMIHSYAARKTTAEAIRENLHRASQAFDREFRRGSNAQTKRTVEHFDDWKKGLRESRGLESGQARRSDQGGACASVMNIPITWAAAALELLAMAMQRGEKRPGRGAARSTGKRAERTGGLAKQLVRSKPKPGESGEDTLGKLIYIYPEDEELHRKWELRLKNGGTRRHHASIGPSGFASADTAQAHFDLAQALRRRQKQRSERQVLIALEARTRF